MDCDDHTPAGRTTLLMKGLTGNVADVAFGQTRRFSRLTDLPENSIDLTSPFREEVRPPYFKMFPSIQGFLATKQFLEAVDEFRVDLNAAAEDVDCVVRMRLRARSMVRTDAVCYYYRYSANSITSSINTQFIRSKLRFAEYAAASIISEDRVTPMEGAALSRFLRGCTGQFLRKGDRAGVVAAIQSRKFNRAQFGHSDATRTLESMLAVLGGFGLLKWAQGIRLNVNLIRGRHSLGND